MNAARDYSEAIRVNPTFNLAHFNIGNMYFHHRQFAQVSVCEGGVGEGAGGRFRVSVKDGGEGAGGRCRVGECEGWGRGCWWEV